MAISNNDTFDGKKVWGVCHFYEDEIRMVVGFPSKAYYINYIIGLILNILLTISTIFLNSLTILAYMISPQLASKKAYFLILLLSVNDLLVGLFGNTSYVLMLFTIVVEHPSCKIRILYNFAVFCSASMSTVTLFALNIERYLAVLHPIYHRTEVTKSRILKIVVALWLLVLAVRLSGLVFGKAVYIIISTLSCFIAFSSLYIYVVIYLTVKASSRSVDRLETDEQVTEVKVMGRISRAKQIHMIKMAKSCAIAVGLTLCCNVPFTITYSQPANDTLLLSVLWSVTISLSASSLNSLVFFWNNPVLRAEAKKIFKNICVYGKINRPQ